MKKTLKGYLAGLLSAALLLCGTTYAANTVRIVLDNKELIATDVNGNRVDAIVIDGTTYLPVRAIANAFGKAVYWDGETSTVYLGDHNGDLPYPTAKLVDLDNIGTSWGWGKTSTLTDNYGNYYSNAICTKESDMTAEYLLNGKYSRFKATIYIQEGESSDNSGGIVITADGKDIYTSPKITKISRTIDIDLSVKGCNDFKITRTGDRYPTIYIGDGGFYQ